MARGQCEQTGWAARFLAAGTLTTIGATIAAIIGLISACPGAHAASFTAKDLQVLGRAVAFMQPPPPNDAVIAIVYVEGNAASRQDAEAIAALIGAGLPVGRTTMRPRTADVDHLAAAGPSVVIAASGANGPRLYAATRSARALCVTTDIEAVRTGVCAMAISSEPRVEIVVNHAASAAAGIDFAAAFRMMIREL